jgi:hypothetical protein
MSDPIDLAYHLKWFYEHCAAHHYLLDTATPMLDVAVAIMHHIHQLNVLFVSNLHSTMLRQVYQVRWEGGHPRLHLVLSCQCRREGGVQYTVGEGQPGSRKLPRRARGMLDEPHCLHRGR